MRSFLVWVISITLLGALLRFVALGDLPPGLYRDEAYYGLDAVDVLHGESPIFFETNNGREPLFIYLVAASIAALGQTPVAVRLVAAVAGALTIPATALMARALFSDRVGLLAAAVTAVTVWTVNLSRVGFRASTMPLVVALAVWQGALAFKTRRPVHFIAAGALYGLLFYTYLAARFTPVALLVALAVWWWTQPPSGRAKFPWRSVGLALGTAAVVVAPLAFYTLTHAHDALARGGQVSILNPAVNQGDPLGTLVSQSVATLGMFTTRGDFIPRHNVPLRPVFDPFLALAAVIGLGVSLARWRRPAYGFVLAWTATMLLPTILAEDAPHFLRAVGILPVALVIPSLGLDAIWTWLAQRGRPRLAAVMVGTALALALMLTVRDYFVIHARGDAAYYQFETGATELAADINRFLGTGWMGGWAASRAARPDGRRAYIDPRLLEGWAGLRFLTTSSGVRTLTTERAIFGDAVLLALAPNGDHDGALGQLPRDQTIEGRLGAYEQGDLAPRPRPLYYTVRATPGKPPATLGLDLGAAGLRDAQWWPTPNGARVRLVWDATGPLPATTSAFVHVLGAGGLLGQADGPPGGLFPARVWRAGDSVVEERHMELPADAAPIEVRVGLYDTRSLVRQPLPGGAEYVVVPRRGGA